MAGIHFFESEGEVKIVPFTVTVEDRNHKPLQGTETWELCEPGHLSVC